MKQLTIGISPCPNDTFIFDALVNGKINTGGIKLEVYMEDVQTLNEWALQGKLDILKISYGTYPLVRDKYKLLHAGGAMGRGVGPLLISKQIKPTVNPYAYRKQIEASNILLPGKNTTAHFLFSSAFPNAMNKTFVPFDTIESAIVNQQAEFGVIIHENRFTYQQKGLICWADLGTLWEDRTGLPIPLGGIVIRKSLGSETADQINDLIRESLAYSRKHYPVLSDFVKNHAQEMGEETMRQHIDLYVTDFSDDLGVEGEKAIQELVRYIEHEGSSLQ
jgi:1,4-dihydroxy-6-naphthoate synthase